MAGKLISIEGSQACEKESCQVGKTSPGTSDNTNFSPPHPLFTMENGEKERYHCSIDSRSGKGYELVPFSCYLACSMTFSRLLCSTLLKSFSLLYRASVSLFTDPASDIASLVLSASWFTVDSFSSLLTISCPLLSSISRTLFTSYNSRQLRRADAPKNTESDL